MTASESRAIVELDTWVPMRDGTRLATDIYRPDDGDQHPVLVHRTPYTKAAGTAVLEPLAAVRAGYVVVMQESRGRNGSEGSFRPFRSEAADGYDTIEWAAEQPWSTGAVGTFGSSGNGASAVQALTAAPPHLRCAAVSFTGFNLYNGWVYANGALELAFLHAWVKRFAGSSLEKLSVDDETRQRVYTEFAEWSESPTVALRALPLNAAFPAELAPFFYEWLAHPSYDDYWAAVDAVALADRITVPVLHLTGWYDGFQVGHLDFQRALQRHPDSTVRDQSRLVIGPWDHHAYLSPNKPSWSGERDFGGQAVSGPSLTAPLLLDWFARWLTDDHRVDTGPPIRYFVMGENVWRDAAEWPPPTSDIAWFLHRAAPASLSTATGNLQANAPRDDDPPDSYRYDPDDPTPTMGGRHLGIEFAPAGIQDQSILEQRSDVLAYRSPLLLDPIRVAGRVRVRLYAETSAPDTDFCATVIDLEPNGKLINVAEGIIRARYRNGTHEPVFLEPGQIVEYDIDCWDVAHTFGVGHRIILHLSSANFPRHDRNLNVVGPIADVPAKDAVIATQTIYHDSERPSCVVLPVVVD